MSVAATNAQAPGGARLAAPTWLFLLAVALPLAAPRLWAADAAAAQARADLAATQAAISAIDDWLEAANSRQSREEKRLQTAVTRLAETSRRAAELAQEITRLERRGESLGQARSAQIQRLRSRERDAAETLRQMHRQGPLNPLRAFLGGRKQGGPDAVARQLHYLGKVSQAQRASLNDYRLAVAELERNERDLQAQRQALTRTQQELADALNTLTAERSEREAALDSLAKEVAGQRGEREQLEMDRAGIEQLLTQIETALRRIPQPPSGTRFSTLKGRLEAPVDAAISRSFGSDANGLSHRGMNFRSAPGDEVLAVHGGRVVFADFLRGAGLLVIVDHGEGYMTLYGGNESLRVDAGESVAAGDVIASAGDGTGAQQSGLYFEIRKEGVAQDPATWLRQQR